MRSSSSMVYFCNTPEPLNPVFLNYKHTEYHQQDGFCLECVPQIPQMRSEPPDSENDRRDLYQYDPQHGSQK